MCLILSNLILVSTVYDAQEQMKLAGKELKAIGLLTMPYLDCF